MAEWDDRVEAHPALATLATSRERLDALPVPGDEPTLLKIERAKRVMSAMSSLVSDADAMLLSPALLQVVQNVMQGVPDLLQGMIDRGDLVDLDAVNDALDNLIHNVGWPLAYAAREPAGLRDAAANYRRSAGQLIRALGDEATEVRGQLDEVATGADAAKVALQDAATTATAAVMAAATDAETSLAVLNAEIEAQKTRLATLMSDYNTQFLAGETARATKSDTTLAATLATAEESFEDLTAKFEASRSAAEEKYNATTTASKAAADARLAEIDTVKEQALKLVNTIGAIGFSGSYGAYAEQERGPAKAWRRIAAGLLLILIAVQVGLAIYIGPTAITWENIAQRGLVSVPFVVLAAYAASQSGKHQENSRAARQRELELAAIDPYLVLLSTDDQRAIKAEAARKMFGQVPEAKVKDDTVGAAQLLRLIEEYLKRK